MHINTFDRYVQADSLVHQLDPRVKVGITFLYILSTALLPDGAWVGMGAAWGIAAVGALLAGFTPWNLGRRAFIVLPFTLAALTVVFTLPGPAVAVWPIGPWRLTLSEPGLVRFASIVVRSWLSVQVAILLTLTTPVPDILHALRHLKTPAVLVVVLAFMYRYLFVLADEAQRLLRARAARSARLPDQPAGGSLLWRARVAGYMVGQLMGRSFDRSERVYQAMLARGYRGEWLTMTPHVMRRLDWLALVIALAALLLTQTIGRLW